MFRTQELDTLEFAPEQAEPVLRTLAQERSLIAFGARMTLEQWPLGNLWFPE